MITSTLQLYLDVLMQHSIELIGEADSWPETAQDHLRHIWVHIDVMIEIVPLLPVVDLCKHLEGLNTELDMLRGYKFCHITLWHLQILRSTLLYMSQVIAEYLTPYTELFVVSGPSRQWLTTAALL